MLFTTLGAESILWRSSSSGGGLLESALDSIEAGALSLFAIQFHTSTKACRFGLKTSVEICQNDNFLASVLFLQVGRFMAKIIEFIVPSSFRKKPSKWLPPEEYGKVIPFSLPQKKSA